MSSHSVAQRFNNKRRLVKVSWEKTKDEDQVKNSKPQAQPKVLELFGRAVLSDKLLRELLSESSYTKLIAIRQAEREMDPDVAEQVAAAMKEWATRQGATHFTHWFQPMNGYTAEKHDSFLSLSSDGGIHLKFAGSNLVLNSLPLLSLGAKEKRFADGRGPDQRRARRFLLPQWRHPLYL